MPVHVLRRNNRRYAVSDFFEFPYLAYVDFETQTLGAADPANGWFNGGKVFTYAGGIASEDFETSTLSNNTPPGPDFGWAGSGIVTGLFISSQPARVVTADTGTAVFSVTAAQGFAPYGYQWRLGGVNLSNGGHVSGATSATLTISTITSPDYGNYDCVVTDAQGMSVTSNTAALVNIVTDWAARVVANGGAAPSVGTKSALETFWEGLIADGVVSKMISVNAVVPDNLIASITPFLVGAGSDPWTNSSFVSGDLSVNGLKGDGSSKALHSGLTPSAIFASNNAGLVIYASAVTSATSTDFGAFTLGGGSGDTSVLIAADQGGTSLGELAEVFTIRPNTPTKGAGFYSVQRTGASSCVLYFANSGNAHASVATNTNTNSSAFIAVPMFVFDVNWTGGHQFSPNRLSFVAATKGLSSSEDSALFSRVQTLRTSLGGGFV